ncbi:MAG: DUF948 domain-containing protein [Chlamydiales bacterium]|nr:DUF948 domain-containing protein [Chlamydiales bacterium]
MIMEIIVGAIALTFALLVVFLILTLQDTRKTLKKTDRILTDLHKTLEAISEPSAELIHNVNKLTLDIKKKSEGLDVVFRPLYAMKKEAAEGKNSYEKISEIVGCIADGIRLFSRVKDEIKDYVKSR